MPWSVRRCKKILMKRNGRAGVGGWAVRAGSAGRFICEGIEKPYQYPRVSEQVLGTLQSFLLFSQRLIVYSTLHPLWCLPAGVYSITGYRRHRLYSLL